MKSRITRFKVYGVNKKNLAERFCENILTFNLAHRKAFANLVMALASFMNAKSVTGLAESPVFHYQYSSITDAISQMASTSHDLKRVRKIFKQQWLEYIPVQSVNHFQTDVVNVFREHAPCLEDRQYRHKANTVIADNKPLGIGYPVSEVNVADLISNWSIPFEMQRVTSCENEIEIGAAQIKAICQCEEFANSLNINSCDSSYGVAKYMSEVCQIENLVNVIRLRHGNKIYDAEEAKPKIGAPIVYGQKYYLIEASDEKSYPGKNGYYQVKRSSIYEKAADEEATLERETKKGRRLRIDLRRWKQMKMRTKRGYSMKEVEFDVVGLQVIDQETGQRVFKHDQFVAVLGEKRQNLSLEEVTEEYYHRFDLEVTNRFMKQNLFLQNYQTAEVKHLDNWLVVVQEAMWLLWAASEEVEKVRPKWQIYAPAKEAQEGRKTASETRKGLEKLILSIEKEPYLPKKCEKGKGRQKGEKQVKRKRYEVVRKRTKAVNSRWTMSKKE